MMRKIADAQSTQEKRILSQVMRPYQMKRIRRSRSKTLHRPILFEEVMKASCWKLVTFARHLSKVVRLQVIIVKNMCALESG